MPFVERHELLEVNRKLDLIINFLTNMEKHIMADLTTLTTAVTNQTSVNQSAITLLNGLSAALTVAGTDPVALATLATQINSNASALSAAITANTPVTTAQAAATS